MSIERQNYLLKQRLMAVEHEKFRLAQENAKMAAQLTAMKNRSSSQRPAKAPTPSCAPSPSLTADLLQHDRVIKQELEEHPFSLPSPQNTLDPRSSFSSASSNASSRSPSPSHMDFNGSATSPDMTQHPAAMLCGLQCQFGAAWRPLETIPPTHPAEVQCQPHPQRTRLPYSLTTPALFLILHSVVSSTLLHPLSQLFISLRTGFPLTPTAMTPMLFYLIQWLISTPANPLTTTPQTSSSTSTITETSTLTPSHPPRLPSTFRISLLRRLLACSPALARPLKDATGRALQMKTSDALRGTSRPASVDVENGIVAAARLSNCGARRQGNWSSLMTLAMSIDLIEERKSSGRKPNDKVTRPRNGKRNVRYSNGKRERHTLSASRA